MLVLFNVTVAKEKGGETIEFRQAIWINSEG
jgi:hypothetical protein